MSDRLIAHQRRVRDAVAAAESTDLLGPYWSGLDLELKRTTIREIDSKTAKPFIEKYEWLGTMPAVVYFRFGLFFQGHLGAVAIYSPEYAENLGVWDAYGYTGKIICLSRGACAHWTPTGTASRIIRRSMDLLPSRYEVVTATCDAQAGEIGTVYQAAGFVFVGQMSKGGNRASIVKAGGKTISSRQAQRVYGTRGVSGIREADPSLEVRSVPRKTRYFCFRGSHKQKRINRAAIQHLIKPYPKRTGGSYEIPSTEGPGA